MLYLLDSVAKNLRAVYAPLFERNLPEIYIRALEAAPSPGVRTSLEHLRATWKDVFPAVRPPAPPPPPPVPPCLSLEAGPRVKQRNRPRVARVLPTRQRGTPRAPPERVVASGAA